MKPEMKRKIKIASFTTVFAGAMIVVYLSFKRNVKEVDLKDYQSPYFTLSDMFRSDTAKANNLDNTTKDEETLLNIRALWKMVLDPAVKRYKELYGGNISINSGYRSSAVEILVSGKDYGQHRKGEAADLTTGSANGNAKLYAIIRDLGVFDQLINENDFRWVHVSYKRVGYNRNQQLKL